MGREATGREVNYLDAGLEVYKMETEHGVPHTTALSSAIEAAVNTALRGFARGIRDDILEKAEDLDASEDDDLAEDGVAALLWYGFLLDETLPPEQRIGYERGV